MVILTIVTSILVLFFVFKGCIMITKTKKKKKMLHDGSNISSSSSIITIITKRSWRAVTRKKGWRLGGWFFFFCIFLSSSRIFQIDNTIASSLKRAGKATESSTKKKEFHTVSLFSVLWRFYVCCTLWCRWN